MCLRCSELSSLSCCNKFCSWKLSSWNFWLPFLSSLFSPRSLSICTLKIFYLLVWNLCNFFHEEKSLFEETLFRRRSTAFGSHPLLFEHVVLSLELLDLANFVIECMVKLVVVLLNGPKSTKKMSRSLDFEASLSMRSWFGSSRLHRLMI